MLNQGYVPCDKQIHIKLSEAELQMIRDRMAQMGFKNLSAYVRKMAKMNGVLWQISLEI